MRHQHSHATPAELATQVSRMRRECPELFAYLQKRDAMLQRALSRLPHGEDVELSAVPYSRLSVESALRDLEPGIADIAQR